MKKILVLLIFTSGAFDCFGQNTKTHVEEENLKGKIKYFIENQYHSVDRSEKIERESSAGFHRHDFNYFGNRKKIKEYNSKGEVERVKRYLYKLGNGIELNTIMIYDPRIVKSTYEFKYDEKGRLIEETLRDLLHRSILDFESNIVFKATYRYDDKGNRTHQTQLSDQNQVVNYTSYEYDERGNVTRTNLYRSDDSLKNYSTYKYDKKNNQIEFKNYNSNGIQIHHQTYKYDPRGNLIEEKYYENDGGYMSLTSHKYSYDRRGNWIKRIQFLHSIPQTIYEREYEYFE